ncbi:murein transglycosylase A [Chitinibacter sp. S2-10]|uniref:murein transglycosylase A n=1 Tax=Chitinibacter sp. S2-10 TaxID=3373597 RepID=UPI0039774BF6
MTLRNTLLLTASLLAVFLSACSSVPDTKQGIAIKPIPTLAPSPIPTKYTERSWQQIPAWQQDQLLEGWQAWLNGCTKPRPSWVELCNEAKKLPLETAAIREFLQSRFTPYQLSNPDGKETGLITGYYEPIYPGSLTRTATANQPVYAQPKDLITVALDEIYPELKGKRLRGRVVGNKLLPYPDRKSIVTNGLDAPALAWLTDPMDVQFLQIQGSGRIQLADGSQLRLGYADQNGHPYKPVGRWLVEQQLMDASEVSMQSIKAWAQANPQRIDELLNSNPSYVFFRTLPESDKGPIGSLGIPLTAGYSIAVDPNTIPLGSLVFIATTRPDNDGGIHRLVAAQDTGGAIRGTVRADFFWGTGDAAGELAGKMKQEGRLWLLWPKGLMLPE